MAGFDFLRRKSLAWFAAGLGMLALSACDVSMPSGGALINTSRPVPVALLVPKSSQSTAGLAQWGPPVPQAFLRPRLGWRELGQLLRNLVTDSGFGLKELRLMGRALGSKSLPD